MERKTIKYCALKNAMLVKHNKKLFNKNDGKNWLIILDKNSLTDENDLYKKPKKKSKKHFLEKSVSKK